MEFTLAGEHVRLEPLRSAHAPELLAAAAEDPSLYKWSRVPRTPAEVERYIDSALAGQAAGTAVPFATISLRTGNAIGSTRFWNLERWAWPAGHPSSGPRDYDTCEIGHTWLAASAIRTAANTEAKLLMLTHAFEAWRVLCVTLHTDARNDRSRTAIARIGGKFEGILRAHRLAADDTPRDSARFSIVASEWPEVEKRLKDRLK